MSEEIQAKAAVHRRKKGLGPDPLCAFPATPA
jgi:hypothetical protein